MVRLILKRPDKSSRASKPASSKAALPRIGFWHVAFLLLGMAAMAGISVLAPSLGWSHATTMMRPAPGGMPSQTETTQPGRRGPWGELECTRFSLEEPDDYLPDSTRRLETPRWFFEKHSPQQLGALLASLDLPDGIRKWLLDQSRWQVTAQGVIVAPTPEVLLGLGQPARQRLYATLAECELNVAHRNPFRFRRDGFDEWFAHSGLPAAKLDLLRSLSFTNRGGALCIVDIDVLQREFTPKEFRKVFESLYSEPSLLVRVRLRPDEDMEALARYWGRGGRERKILPLLKSLARLPDGGSVNVACFLPTFARQRLYTFGTATPDGSVTGEDCFWTALNFFNTEPDARLSDQAYALDKLNRDYTETREQARFGDVLILLDESRKTIHACVYLADDVVFTKNGADYLQPWVLMKIPDMLAHYATDGPSTLVTLRPKNL